jgi:hypothetical protein
MIGARNRRIHGPGEPLASVGLELRLDDGPEHRLPPAEQHDRVGAEFDRRKLVERDVGNARLGEAWNLDAEQLTEQIGGERGAIADQLEHTFVQYRHHDNNARK